MKITKARIPVCDVKQGDTFEYENRHFMRVRLAGWIENTGNDIPILSLKDGLVTTMGPEFHVVLTQIEGVCV